MTMAMVSALESKYNDVFDINSKDGFSKDAFRKLVSVIAFLMDHYREIPEKIFNDYLKASSEILSWKDASFPESENNGIPRDLLDDMESIFAQ